MKLTSRLKKMIYLLLDEKDYITVMTIAERTGISSRTVNRDMSQVEEWLNEKGIQLEKKKGTGIRIILEDEKRLELKESLNEEKAEIVYTPNQRLVMLKAELLKNFELTKLYTLTKLFDVTEGTISADLDKLEVWLEKFNLAITRKPGLGINIQGDETSVRSAIISLIYEQFHEADLINLIINKEKHPVNLSGIQNQTSEVIMEFIDMSSIEYAKNLLYFIEQKMGYQIADNSLIALLIRFSVTIKRCGQGIFINEISGYDEKVKSEKIYLLVKEWFEKQSDLMIKLPDEELYILAIHIKGAKLRETFTYNKISMTEDYKTIKLAKEIIYVAERETGIYLEDNEKLLIGLVRHLRPAIYRMKMHLDIMNPLLEDIKQMYPKLFEVTRKCAIIIEQKEHVSVPEDEIAYLATHIGAAIKTEQHQHPKICRAVVACTNGIGASQLLVTEIEREFRNIHIVDTISTIDMDPDKLIKESIQLIISTVPVQVAGMKVVCVNTILNDEDKRSIKEALESVFYSNQTGDRIKTLHFKEKLQRIQHYSNLILQVLEHFSLVENIEIKDVNELISFVSKTIVTKQEDVQELELAFKDREEKGSTILGKRGMMLLHCRSTTVSELYVMVLRLRESIVSHTSREEAFISTIVVMVAPVNINSLALEVLSEITRKIITSDFSITLKQGSEEEIFMGISAILDQFLQSKITVTS